MNENKKRIWVSSEFSQVELEVIDIITSSASGNEDNYEGELDEI